MTEWQRGDVVVDDSGNLFCYHNLHGWHGLMSNQTSARGRFEWAELAEPVRLLIRDNQAGWGVTHDQRRSERIDCNVRDSLGRVRRLRDRPPRCGARHGRNRDLVRMRARTERARRPRWCGR